ncbi:MAG TPA: hypothetical protein VNL77_17820 [Roseiflexaceae bacterium]|nr:hypothetical protein [Roseiflexaceae bacterium]
MLETAIAHYHTLLDPDTARATQEQLTAAQRERNLFFGERPLATVLRPRFITAAQYALLQRACGLVGRAMRRLGDAMLADARLRQGVALTPHEEALVRLDPGYAGHSAHARMDTFLTLDGRSLRFVEFNGESPAAIAYEDVLSDVFRGLPVMERFAERYTLTPLPARARLLDTLLDAWRQFGGTQAPTVAILDWKGLPTRSEFLLFQRFFHEHGIQAAICSPDDLTYRDGALLATDYEIIGPDGAVTPSREPPFPVALVYKRVLTSELLIRYGDAALEHPLMRAYAAGKVCVVNSFRAKLLHKKAIFALLTDDNLSEHFTPEERAAIAAHVPWTRMVRQGASTYQGERIDLLAFARANRERLVLKPNDEYGGKGVVIGWESSADEWDRALSEALLSPTILQERVTIAYEDYPALVDGALQIGPRLVDTDPFMFGDDVQGTLCRLSTVTLLNVTAGGGSTTPVFIIEKV